MASIFTKDDNFVDKPKRNTFDLSFQNNLSLKFGKLIPAYLQEVIPGDSFHIDPTFGLRFLPQVFPVQTRMRAHLHFFYVRNRTIWKNWMDFIGKTKDNLVMPYLLPDKGEQTQLTVSSIYDYMGLPLTIESDDDGEQGNVRLFTNRGKVVRKGSITATGDYIEDARLPLFDFNGNYLYSQLEEQGLFTSIVNLVYLNTPVKNFHGFSQAVRYSVTNLPEDVNSLRIYIVFRGRKAFEPNPDSELIIRSVRITNLPAEAVGEFVNVTSAQVASEISASPETTTPYYLEEVIGYYYPENVGNVSLEFQVAPYVNRGFPISELSDDSIPYGLGDGKLRINALPFRAYEAVYNSFYRNPENNPFMIGGKPEYNKYVVNDDDGPCRLGEFGLFNRNWEDDAFTTAVPTPQQGDAPRVGLTADPNTPVYLNYSREDGSVGKLVLEADADGYVHAVSSSNLDGVPENAHDSSMAKMLNDVVNFGITINDLRNVNSFQRWLEKNVRKGYRYRDQLMSHYGVSVSYKDMMMPEFIGGMSRDVTVNQISQTVETESGNLGDMAGQAYVVGDGKRISHFCDEHGYIIGILSVAPVPNYSQLIPKHFFKADALDYFFPEFGKIGMQPITNKEIAAIASYIEGKTDNTFGYQRAWYDYLARVDEVHGQFNTDFYDFLIQRKFANVPELGAKFTTIENDDLNNIFYVDDGRDKILGQIYFQVSGIRPIPMYGIPALE